MTDAPGRTAGDAHYARLRRAHRDAKADTPRGDRRAATPADEGPVRLYGLHTVAAALANPDRRSHRLLVTRNALGRLALATAEAPCPVEIVEPKTIDGLLGAEAVHQGAMLEADPLPQRRLESLAGGRLVVVLDQVTDPHNVGAILRTASAFGADALLTTTRHAPRAGGVLAKAASGALEHVPVVGVVNLTEALETLKGDGFTTLGLDSEAPHAIEAAATQGPMALVLGAEGKGLRAKTRATVDALVRLPMPGAIQSLNVSNAAAIMLYAARQWQADAGR